MSASVSYQDMILSSLGNKIVPSGANLFVTNQNTSSTRYSPYMELIFQINENDTSYAIYNTFLKYISVYSMQLSSVVKYFLHQAMHPSPIPEIFFLSKSR